MESDRTVMMQENRQIHIQIEQMGNRAMAQKGLTATQAQVLLYILNHAEQGVSLTDIHREFRYSMAALSELVKRLREKIKDHAGWAITTVWGIGYKFEVKK